MNWAKKVVSFIHSGTDSEKAMELMVYSYVKCMPLVLMEMGMRQNVADIGNIVRIPDFMGRPAWGAWLALSVTSYIIDIPEGPTIYMYDAWNEIKRTESGPDSFLIHLGGRTFADFHSLRSKTSIARIVVTAPSSEYGEYITLRYIDPLVNEYVGSVSSADYKRATVTDYDPKSLSGREYFALASTLVSANPTDDNKITKGLNRMSSAPAPILEMVKTRALSIIG